MLPAMFRGKVKSNKELIDKTEAYIQSVKDLYEKAERDSLCIEVEQILAAKPSGWYGRLSELMQSEAHRDVIQIDKGLFVLKKVYVAQNGLSRMTSLKEVQEVYQKAVFYLRRIELGMHEDGWICLRDLIEKWELSGEYLIAILSGNAIFRNLDTGYRLSQIMVANGYDSYAEELISWIKSQTIRK